MNPTMTGLADPYDLGRQNRRHFTNVKNYGWCFVKMTLRCSLERIEYFMAKPRTLRFALLLDNNFMPSWGVVAYGATKMTDL